MGTPTIGASQGATSAASPVVVRGLNGEPLPNSEIVAEIKKRCGPEYGLKFAAGLASTGWDVVREWPENDRRREWVRQGNYDPAAAYDRIGSLPMGCSLQEAPAFLQRMFADYPALDRETINGIRSRISQWNTQDAARAQIEEAIVGTMEQVQSDMNAPKGLVAFVQGTGHKR